MIGRVLFECSIGLMIEKATVCTLIQHLPVETFGRGSSSTVGERVEVINVQVTAVKAKTVDRVRIKLPGFVIPNDF